MQHLPVLKDERLIGMISIGDVVKATIAQQEFIIEQLENYVGDSVHSTGIQSARDDHGADLHSTRMLTQFPRQRYWTAGAAC